MNGTPRRRRDDRTCRNPRCGEPLNLFSGGRWTGLCPSCRLAGRYGVYAAFGIYVAGKLAGLVWGFW